MQDYIPREKDINQIIEPITVKQFDNNSRFLHVQFTDIDLAEDENAFDLENCSVSLYIEPEGNTDPSEIAYINGTVESAENGVMTFLIPGSVTQNVGRYKCEIHINEGDTTTYPAISSKPFFMTVEETIRDDQAIMASAQFSALDRWASDVQNINARMNALVAMADAGEIPAGTVEAEVSDIRAGKGQTYLSAGDAVRAAVQGVDTFVSASAIAAEPINSDFDNFPNNIIRSVGVYNVAQSDGIGGHVVIANAPMLGQLTGIIVTLGRASERKNGDTQIFISYKNRDVFYRQYNRISSSETSTWSEWKTFCDRRIDLETVKQYPTIIDNAWFSGGKTILDLPYNCIFYISNDFSSTYSAVGLPCNGYGTLTKIRPQSNSLTTTGFTVYTFTAISNDDTMQYYAYAKNSQTIANLRWHRYNDATVNGGIDGIGLENKCVAFIGDSIIEGYGSSDYNGGANGTSGQQITNSVKTWYRNTGSKCWVNKMISYLTSTYSGVTAWNNGIGGFTTAQLLSNLNTLIQDDNSNTADVVVISVGTNNRESTDKTTAVVNPLREIIRRLKGRGIQPVVLTNTPIFSHRQINGEWVYEEAPIGNNAETIHSAIVSACNSEGVHCYDMLAEFCDFVWSHGLVPTDYMHRYSSQEPDSLHPNDTGYEIMFQIAKKLLGIPSAAIEPGAVSRAYLSQNEISEVLTG